MAAAPESAIDRPAQVLRDGGAETEEDQEGNQWCSLICIIIIILCQTR